MSYPKDLDEYTDKQLRDELDRRRTSRLSGLCYYCRKPAFITDDAEHNKRVRASGPCKQHETLRRIITLPEFVLVEK